MGLFKPMGPRNPMGRLMDPLKSMGPGVIVPLYPLLEALVKCKTDMDKQSLCFYCCCVILCKLILRLARVYDFRQAALSLNNFAQP